VLPYLISRRIVCFVEKMLTSGFRKKETKNQQAHVILCIKLRLSNLKLNSSTLKKGEMTSWAKMLVYESDTSVTL
jgi:hypothetical protein